jgi:hypothetical protein
MNIKLRFHHSYSRQAHHGHRTPHRKQYAALLKSLLRAIEVFASVRSDHSVISVHLIFNVGTGHCVCRRTDNNTGKLPLTVQEEGILKQGAESADS